MVLLNKSSLTLFIFFIQFCINYKICVIFALKNSSVKYNNITMDAVVAFILERWPVLAAILAAVVVTVVICRWYFSRFIPTEKTAEANRKRFDELPCSRHEEEITSIRAYLLVKYPKAFGTYAQKKSPRRLNKEGERLFEEMGGAAFLEANGTRLMDVVEKKHPKTPLDVELFALDALYGLLNDDMFNDIKRWVYDCPVRKVNVDGVEKDYEVTINDVCFVLSIPLRDMYLEFHPESR